MSHESPRVPITFWLPPILAVAAVALVFYLKFQPNEQVTQSAKNFHKQYPKIMGTQANIIISPENKLKITPEAAADEAFAAAKRIEQLMNAYSEESEISKINNTPVGHKIAVSPLTWRIITEAMRFNLLSNGAFNPLMGSLIHLYKWNNSQDKALPQKDILTPALQASAISNLELTREGMFVSRKNNLTKLDLGGIAKGMGVDSAADTLLRLGVKNAIVEIGGEVRLIGHAPSSNALGDKIGDNLKPWSTGIQNPRGSGIIEVIKEKGNYAVATSGDYEKFFDIDGKRYSHIINPGTGLPVSGGVISATVILSDSCLQADALATSACVLGREKFATLLNLFPDAQAILILEDGTKIHLKSNFVNTVRPDSQKDKATPDYTPHNFRSPSIYTTTAGRY